MSAEASVLSETKSDIFTLRAEEIERYWPQIVKFLLMIPDPDWLPDQVLAYLKDGRAQLWGMANLTGIQGIWITRIDETASARFGFIWIAAGRGLDAGVPAYLECTEAWFREKECEYIEIHGRKGWAKALPGFNIHSHILRKRL